MESVGVIEAKRAGAELRAKARDVVREAKAAERLRDSRPHEVWLEVRDYDKLRLRILVRVDRNRKAARFYIDSLHFATVAEPGTLARWIACVEGTDLNYNANWSGDEIFTSTI